MKQIGTRLSNDIFERLQKDAEKSGTNISDLLRQIVGGHYEKTQSDERAEQILTAVQEANRANLVAFADLMSTLSKTQAVEKDFRIQVRKALNIPAAPTTQPAATAAAQQQQPTKN